MRIFNKNQGFRGAKIAEYFRSIRVFFEYKSSVFGFQKKTTSKKINTKVKTGFLIKKSVYLVFILLLLPRLFRLDGSCGGSLPTLVPLHIHYCVIGMIKQHKMTYGKKVNVAINVFKQEEIRVGRKTRAGYLKEGRNTLRGP